MTPQQRAEQMDAIIAAARSRGADLRSITPLDRDGWRIVAAWGSLTSRTMVILEGDELATLLELMPRVEDFVDEIELRDQARRKVEA